MGRAMQIRPARVLDTVTQEILGNGVMARYRRMIPPWFDVLHRVPPSAKTPRTIPIVHQAQNKQMKRPRYTFIPHQIRFPEDNLRAIFFKHHPWELARPRVMAETDGRDAERMDWSTGLRQPGMPLCGESVVQRQLWLMQNEGLERDQAYDKARKEFYGLRHEDQVEQRLAKEEAMYAGGYFGKSRLDVSLGVEDQEFESWKNWAEKQIALAADTSKSLVGPSAPPVAAAPAPNGEAKTENENAGARMERPTTPRGSAPRARMPVWSL